VAAYFLQFGQEIHQRRSRKGVETNSALESRGQIMRVHVSIAGFALLIGIAAGVAIAYGFSGPRLVPNTSIAPHPEPSAFAAEPERKPPDAKSSHAEVELPKQISGEAPSTAPAPLSDDDIKTYAIHTRVQDRLGAAVGGVRFRWHPDLTAEFNRHPVAEDFPDEAAFRAALHAHLERIAQRKLRGTQEATSDAYGELLIADAVTTAGWLELLDENYAFTRQASDNRIRISSASSQAVTISPAAELEFRVLLDGKDAEIATLTLNYRCPVGGSFMLPNLRLPARVRVPIGEARASVGRLEPEGVTQSRDTFIRAGELNRLELHAHAPITLAVETDLPAGSSARIQLKHASEALTDEQIALDNSFRELHAQREGNRALFKPPAAGDYVVIVRAGGLLLATRRVSVGPAANEVLINVAQPADMTRHVLRITLDGKPLPDAWDPLIWISPRVPYFLWSRSGEEFVLLIHQDARQAGIAHVAVQLRHGGTLTREFNSGFPPTQDIPFVTPVQLSVELTGLRPDMAGTFSLFAVGMEDNAGGWSRVVGSHIPGDDGNAKWHFAALQPGRYSINISWHAGMSVHGDDPVHTLLVTAENSKASVTLPAYHVLSLELPENAVSGLIAVKDSRGEMVARVSQSNRSPLTHIRFLRTGTYTLEYKDRSGRDYQHHVAVSGDMVFKP
jgi:hypothetical protein